MNPRLGTLEKILLPVSLFSILVCAVSPAVAERSECDRCARAGGKLTRAVVGK